MSIFCSQVLWRQNQSKIWSKIQLSEQRRLGNCSNNAKAWITLVEDHHFHIQQFHCFQPNKPRFNKKILCCLWYLANSMKYRCFLRCEFRILDWVIKLWHVWPRLCPSNQFIIDLYWYYNVILSIHIAPNEMLFLNFFYLSES